MKSNINLIIVALVAAALGLGAGYVIFGKKADAAMTQEMHQHEAESAPASNEEEIWTCSMHPQIRQNEFGLCPICEMDLIPLEANTSNDPLVLEMTEEAVKLSNIQTTLVGATEGQTGKVIRLSGKIKADERLASSQVAHVPGRVEKLYVTFTGEQVNKGQKLADIYAPDLITAQGELLEALRLKDINPALVEAARKKLSYWKIDATTIKEIEESGIIRETFTLFAEESGIVSNRRISVGDYVQKGEPLFDLMNLNKVWILFDVYEEDLALIKIGDRVEFNTPAIPNRTFKSRITFIDPILNSQTRTASIRTEMNNTSKALKPEMLVYGNLQKNASKNTNISVPKSAVLWTGKRSVVYVKMADMEIPSFQYREVELGESLGDSYQVVGGLELGEEVVTYGSFTIDAAAQLNNQTSMMNKRVEIKKEAVGIPNFQEQTPENFKQQLNLLASEYIHLKDAFVATNAQQATEKAKQVLKQLESIDMNLLEGEAHVYWMEQLNALKAHGENIVEMTDVEEQRRQFGFLSEALINSIQAFGTSSESLYIQHCPMAFDNEGGDWLALEEQIQNPYFGDKMMKCGSVKKALVKSE